MSIQNIIMMLTGMVIALMAGLFFFWSLVIMPGMSKLNDYQYVEAMQNFNREILHPLFYIVFIGSIILLPITAYLEYRNGISQKFWMLLAAFIVYLLGVVLVTFFVNVPLNNNLEAFDLKSSQEQYENMRLSFEGRWNNFNLLRTVSSFITLVLVLITIIKK